MFLFEKNESRLFGFSLKEFLAKKVVREFPHLITGVWEAGDPISTIAWQQLFVKEIRGQTVSLHQ
jgi:hypothetical protein